jgi:hypothetical protein
MGAGDWLIFLPPSLYRAAEEAGYDMTWYRPQQLIPTGAQSMERYLLFNPDMSGFMSDQGTWTSDYRDAKAVDYETAIQYCRKHMQKDGFGEVFLKLLPVKYADVRRIVGD